MKPVRRRHPHPEIPLVSTADVSFLLLIFFLSTAIFASERGIVLGLPIPGTSETVARGDRIARLTIAADQSVLLDGKEMPRERLREALAARLRIDPELLVALAVDGHAPYAALVATLDQLKLAGARRISLETETHS
jgi:biopolymer transport protein ExbD